MDIEERAKQLAFIQGGISEYGKKVIEKCCVQIATEQQKIDIKKACKAVCSFCQDKEKCDAESYDAIEHIRLAVSCEKIDKIVEAMEG